MLLYTECRVHRYTYFMEKIPQMNKYLKPFDEILRKNLPTLMESIVSDDERNLYLLPIRGGGLGIPILEECASIQNL